MTKLNCELNIFSKTMHIMHISQIVTGFLMLEKEGIINLKINYLPHRVGSIPSVAFVEAVLNGKIKIAYDMLDGYNFERNTEEYLSQTDFYFKRSYNPVYHTNLENASRIFPLGFNYPVTTSNNILDKPTFESPGKFLKKCLKNILKSYHAEKFEDIPHQNNKESRVLFIAKLWEPEENTIQNYENFQELKEEREYINNMRIECINKLRRQFKDKFIGGLSPTEYANKNFPNYVINNALTIRPNFMKLIKESDICIASMGLYKSNGWKLGEYLAAGKAIVSEKLHYSVPGNFEAGRNYLEFNNSDGCVEKTVQLAENPEFAYSMKVNNYNYYHNYLRPDRLIFNSLALALEKY